MRNERLTYRNDISSEIRPILAYHGSTRTTAPVPVTDLHAVQQAVAKTPGIHLSPPAIALIDSIETGATPIHDLFVWFAHRGANRKT